MEKWVKATNKVADRMVKKDGTLCARYEYVAMRIVDSIREGKKSDRWHDRTWSGHYARHQNLIDEGFKFADILNAFGIAYKVGNDAPRGGEEGHYYEAKFDGRNPVVKYLRTASKAYLTTIDMVNTILSCKRLSK